MNRYLKAALIFATGILLVMAFRQFAMGKPAALWGEAPKDVPYSQFVQNVEAGGIVTRGTFRKEFFEGEYAKTGAGATKGNNKFIVALPPDAESRSKLQQLLQDKGVKYEYAQIGRAHV